MSIRLLLVALMSLALSAPSAGADAPLVYQFNSQSALGEGLIEPDCTKGKNFLHRSENHREVQRGVGGCFQFESK